MMMMAVVFGKKMKMKRLNKISPTRKINALLK